MTQKTELCTGFLLSSQIDTVHKNNKNEIMDGDCSVDCEKTVLCECLHIGHQSLVRSGCVSYCDTQQGREKRRKNTRCTHDTVDARPSFALNQHAAHTLLLALLGVLASIFLGVGRETAATFCLRWFTRFVAAAALHNVRLKGGGCLHGGNVEGCA